MPPTTIHDPRLTSVDEGVLLHVRLLVEALPTVLAGVGPDVGVDEQMRGQSGGTLEDLSAHCTTKGFPLQYKRDGLGASYVT